LNDRVDITKVNTIEKGKAAAQEQYPRSILLCQMKALQHCEHWITSQSYCILLKIHTVQFTLP